MDNPKTSQSELMSCISNTLQGLKILETGASTPALEVLRKHMIKLVSCMHAYTRVLKEIVCDKNTSKDWLEMAEEYSVRGYGGKCIDLTS